MSGGAPGLRATVWEWLDDRLGLSGLRYPIPDHANSLPYALGGLSLVSFVLLAVTGIYLSQYYDPTSGATAHESVRYITDEAFLGEFVRSAHYWLATAFVITMVLHMVRAFATASFKAPREFTWISGALLAALVGAALFTGTALKNDQQAVESVERREEIVDVFGGLGFWFSSEFTHSVDTLTRVYVSHVTVLPGLIALLVAGHMLLIKRHGISPLPWGTPTEIRRRERRTMFLTFESHTRHIGRWALLITAGVVVLALVLPPSLGPLGRPALEVSRPPWYFLWLHEPDGWFGHAALIVPIAGVLVALLALPFLDRSLERDPRRRKPWIAAGAAFLLLWVALTVAGAAGSA